MPLISNFKGPQGEQGSQGTDGIGLPGFQGSQGAPGNQGEVGVAGTVTYSGAATPANTLGVDGDYFINTATGDLLQKVAGSW